MECKFGKKTEKAGNKRTLPGEFSSFLPFPIAFKAYRITHDDFFSRRQFGREGGRASQIKAETTKDTS
jgi:hypothetical protein